MVNPAIFETLQAKIDEDAQVREELRNILQVLEKQGRASFLFFFPLLSGPSRTNQPKAEQRNQYYLAHIRHLQHNVG